VSDHDLAAVDEILSAYQIVGALLLFHRSDAGKCTNPSRRDDLSEEEGVPYEFRMGAACGLGRERLL